MIDHRDIGVFVVVDMAKEAHYAQAITAARKEVFHRPVPNDETAIERVIVDASKHRRVVFVIDMRRRARSRCSRSRAGTWCRSRM